MPLFSLPPSNGSARDAETTLHQAVGAVVERARQRGLLAAPCWSLAELSPDEADYTWLNEWAGGLRQHLARRWLCDPLSSLDFGELRLSRRACLGCLLLMLASEAARREVTEGGTLWPFVRRGRDGPRFASDTERDFFLQGQPTELYKDALEAAARRMRLRHAFGMEDVQHYYASVSLQYGFSHRGLLRRLPDWLVGQGRTQAIEQLLEGRLRSDSFANLWEQLRLYRLGNIREQRLRQVLASCPWVLPAWIDDVVERATGRASGGDGGGAIASQGEAALPFLDEPVLRWDGVDAPCFTCRLINLANFDLLEDFYDVVLGGLRMARLVRQADESYCARPAGELRLPAVSPSVAATLVAGSQVVACQELRLWNPEEDVTVYRLPGGQRLDPGEAMNPQTSYALRAARDLTLNPPTEVWQQLSPSAGTLRRLPAGWSPETRLCAGEAEVWQPPISGRAPVEPGWASGVSIRQEGGGAAVALGAPFDVRVDAPANIEVRFARWQGQPIDVRPGGGGTTMAGPVSVSPAQCDPWVELTLGLRRGTETATVRRQLIAFCRGGSRLDDNGWTVLKEDAELTVEQTQLQPFRLWPPDPAARLDEWAVLEGSVWVGRPSRQPRPLGVLAGFGAELRVVRGPYNLRGQPLVLAHIVIDRGVLRDVSLTPECGSALLQFTNPVEPDALHQVVWWGRTGIAYLRPRLRSAGEEADFGHWVVDWPEVGEPLAIAVAYDGYRLGAWWSWDWADNLLERAGSVGGPRALASLIRWLGLPVLERLSLPRMRELARVFPAEILTAWLFDAAPEPLQWGAPGSGWLPAIAEVFSGWQPRPAELIGLLQAVASLVPNTDQPALFLLLSLLQVDPLMMARVTQVLLQVPPPGSAPPSLDVLTRAVAQVGPSVTRSEVERARNALPDEVAPVMGADSGFVRGLVHEVVSAFRKKVPLSGFDAMNYAVGVAALEPFRRLLGLHLLSEIERTLSSAKG